MSKQSPQIVHESEAQRQHVRVQIPATAFLAGKEFAVKNLSNGGVQILDVTQKYKTSQPVDIILSLPFQGFSMSVDLKAEVEYYDSKENTLGCKFIELSDEQISLLNNVLKSYISGHVVTEGDVLSVISRNNFMTVRKKPTVDTPSLNKAELIKRAAPMASILLVGLIVVGLLIGNLYERISVVKSYHGVIQTETITVRAHTDGLFKSLVSENRTVSMGDPIGELYTRVMVPTQGDNKKDNDNDDFFVTHKEIVKSPCDCNVIYQNVQNGEFRSMGEGIFKLVPIDADPWVSVTLPSEDAYRINIHDDVNLHIGGEALRVEGIVIDMDTKGTDSPISILKVQATETLANELVGRPVYAEFFVY